MFRINGCPGYVSVMDNEPVRVDIEQSEWRDMANQWYLDEAALEVPLVWDNGEEALQKYDSITADQATVPPVTPIDTDGRVTNELLENEKLSFDTTAIGQPHYVRISYFPNWHVKGAEGPYLVSPSMMMVIPTESHVTLYYGRTMANTAGQILEVLAWVVLLCLTVWRVIVWRRRKKLAGAMQGAGPIVGAGEFDGETFGAGEFDRFGDSVADLADESPKTPADDEGRPSI